MIRITRTVEHSAPVQNYINLYPVFISLVDQHLSAGYKMYLHAPAKHRMGQLSGIAILTVSLF
jgi:hypothetical protein